MLRIRVDGLHHIATIRRHGNCEFPMRHQLKIAFHIDPGDGGTLMPARDAISFDKLARIIGTPRASLLLDVLSAGDFAADGHHRSRGGRHPEPRGLVRSACGSRRGADHFPYGLAIDVPVWSTLKLAAAALVLAALIAVSPFRIRPMTVLRVALQLVWRCEWLA
jgi:hypothetical protein